jgi:hypothetical protein
MFLVIISLLVFIVVAVAFLTEFNIVKTRTSLALAGVFVVALGIVSGWGWGMIFGMPFTPLQREFVWRVLMGRNCMGASQDVLCCCLHAQVLSVLPARTWMFNLSRAASQVVVGRIKLVPPFSAEFVQCFSLCC